MLKKDMKTLPLHSGSSKKPDVIKHDGKGSKQGPLRQQNNFDGARGGDYGKTNDTTDNAPWPGMGTGDWAGNIG